MRSVEALERRDAEGDNRPHSKRRVPWTKGSGHSRAQCVHLGAARSKEELWEAARAEEMKIPWRAANEGPPVPEEQYQERFWRRRLDGMGLDTATKESLAIEFKQKQDARNYVEKATAVAQEKYKSLLTVLQAVGQLKGWEVQPGVRRRDVRIRSC